MSTAWPSPRLQVFKTSRAPPLTASNGSIQRWVVDRLPRAYPAGLHATRSVVWKMFPTTFCTLCVLHLSRDTNEAMNHILCLEPLFTITKRRFRSWQLYGHSDASVLQQHWPGT